MSLSRPSITLLTMLALTFPAGLASAQDAATLTDAETVEFSDAELIREAVLVAEEVPTAAIRRLERNICSAERLRARLASAQAGAVIQIGYCKIEGNFEVPAGVRITGVGPRRSILVGVGGTPAVLLRTNAQQVYPTALSNLAVYSPAFAAVLTDGDGRAALEGVNVHVKRGLGVAAEGLGSLALAKVNVIGPVTAWSAASTDPNATPAEAATHGIVVVRTTEATFKAVRVWGFASMGALAVESNTFWSGVSASQNVGAGLVLWGGVAQISALKTVSNWRGLAGEGQYPAGLAILGRADATTTNVYSSDNEGYAVFHNDAQIVEHNRLTALDNDQGGVWTQLTDYVQLDESYIYGVSGGAFVALASGLVSVANTKIGKALVDAVEGEKIGDGIHLRHTVGDFFNVSLGDFERVGILAELLPGQDPSEYTFESVELSSGFPGAFGALFQSGGQVFPLQENGINRSVALREMDVKAIANGIVLPNIAGEPIPDWIPAANNVFQNGLQGLLGQSPN